MDLLNIVEVIDAFSDNETIYSVKDKSQWTPASEAYVAEESEDGTLPVSNLGVIGEYFIEIHLAKDAIRVWREWRNGAIPSKMEKFKAVLHYVQYDSFMPVDESCSGHSND